ncbi:MAG: cold shock domain-containing protein [Cyanobacteria bacterium]|nr:cold shock domain-containing protein [Cyanobacteriota bacterium]
MRYQGRLKAWKADRGFGFITSSAIEGDVFLHISALPSNIRPPQVGDTILFELQIQPDGRKRAAKAAIQGIPPTLSRPSTPSRTINRSHIYTSANKSSKRRNGLGALLFLVVAVVLGIRFVGGLIQPSATTVQSETTTEQPETTTGQLETITNQSETTAQPEITTGQPETTAGQPETTAGQPETTTAQPENIITCNVKGNISIDTGKKIYHAPGMKDYEITRISPEHGERWFCSEEEAVENGWTRGPD